MATKFADKNDVHFDATTGTLEADGDEIPGVQAFSVDPGKQEMGSVVAVGSQVEIGVTPGAHEPGEPSFKIYLADLAKWLKTVQDRLGTVPYRSHLFTFTATWAFLDEESNPQPSQTYEFFGYLKVPQKFDTDRTQGSQPILVDVPIRQFGRAKLNGVEL